jgi:hypothetical protein
MHKIILILIFFILNSSFLILNCPCQWSQVLNNSGGTNDFRALATDNDYIYAATVSSGTMPGLYRSSNNGINWTLVSLQSSGAKYLEKNGNVLIAVSDLGNILMYSTNQGLNWTNTSYTNTLDLSGNAFKLFAVSQSVVIKSTSSGINWIQLPMNGLAAPFCVASRDSFVFASNSVGVMFRISDNTSNWVNVNSGLPTPVEYSVWDINTAGQSVFCSVYATGGTGVNSGIYRTTNNGSNWVKVTFASGYTYNLGHNIFVMDSVLLYCALNTLYLSTNNGNNWTSKFGNLPYNTSVNTFTHKGDYVYTGTSNGVWRMPKSVFLTGIKIISNSVPENFSLEQNYPNPFNAVTKIQFKVESYKFVKLIVFDLIGREVATLVNQELQPGTYEISLDAGNLTSGIYFYRLTARNFSETKKLILLK